MPSLGRTGLDVFPICLGGNVFGWTADEAGSFEVLDAYAAAGGNFIDTANSYLVEHGRSETIIGRWMADRGNRDELVIATKVGGGRKFRNLRPETIESEAQASLERLRTDRIDLYYAHFDDEETPLEDTLRAFDELVQAGTVRRIAASNYSPERLNAALELQREKGLAEFTALQPHYNLVEREFERTLLPVADAWDLAVLPYLRAGQGLPDRQVPARRQGREVRARRGRPRLPRRRRRGRAGGARRGRRRARRSRCPPSRSPGCGRTRAWRRRSPARGRSSSSSRSSRRRRSSSRPRRSTCCRPPRALSAEKPLGIDGQVAASHPRRVSRPQPFPNKRDPSEAHT